MLRKKRDIFSKHNINVICPAKWLYDEAINVFPEKRVSLIFNSVDSDIFIPSENKNNLKEKYGLPLNKKIILFSANNFKDVNKGGKYFLELAENLKNESFVFCVVGFSDFPDYENIFKLGYIYEREKLAEIYSLSDLYCFLSAVETAPLSVLEAMSCALPIVGFKIKGLDGMVDKNNGELSDYGDVSNLKIKILRMLDNHNSLRVMSENSRNLILKSFNKENYFSFYKNIYISK